MNLQTHMRAFFVSENYLYDLFYGVRKKMHDIIRSFLGADGLDKERFVSVVNDSVNIAEM